VLVMAQVALSLVALIGASLFVRKPAQYRLHRLWALTFRIWRLSRSTVTDRL